MVLRAFRPLSLLGGMVFLAKHVQPLVPSLYHTFYHIFREVMTQPHLCIPPICPGSQMGLNSLWSRSEVR